MPPDGILNQMKIYDLEMVGVQVLFLVCCWFHTSSMCTCEGVRIVMIVGVMLLVTGVGSLRWEVQKVFDLCRRLRNACL